MQLAASIKKFNKLQTEINAINMKLKIMNGL